jgi:hypothetical protein
MGHCRIRDESGDLRPPKHLDKKVETLIQSGAISLSQTSESLNGINHARLGYSPLGSSV